jgi:hypothetical protein
MKFSRGLAFVALCALVITAGRLQSARAQDDGFNIVTSPITVNVSGAPGTTITTDLRVKNNGNKTEKLKLSLMKFSAYGEEGKPAIQDRGEHDDYFDWVTFTPNAFDAEPNEWKTVKMTIDLPKDAAFGYYYAAVFSRASEVEPVPGQSVLQGSAAILVLTEAKVPNAKRSAELLSFKPSKSWYEFLPAAFSVRLHNDGNVHVAPQGNIFITKGKSNVATIKINDQAGNILPDSNRIFTTEWNDGFPSYKFKEANGKVVTDKNGKQVKSLRWDFAQIAKLRFGRYTAHLVMAYDNGKQDVPIEATVSFWVIPWRIIGFSILFIVLSAVGAWTIGKWTGRHIRHKKQMKNS